MVFASHVSLVGYLVVLVAAGLGAALQSTIGFGAAIVAVPVLSLVVPEAVPATVIVWVLPLVVVMALRERHGVDWPGVGWMTAGRLPGTAVGVWVVSSVTVDTLTVLAGFCVLVAVATSVIATTVPLTPTSQTAAGFASGVMGTSTSIGGPPLALLYQRQAGFVLRATLSVGFVVGISISLVGLAAVGAVEAWQVWLALALVPGHVVGLLLSRRVVGRVDEVWLRPAVLGFVAVTAAVAIARGLM